MTRRKPILKELTWRGTGNGIMAPANVWARTTTMALASFLIRRPNPKTPSPSKTSIPPQGSQHTGVPRSPTYPSNLNDPYNAYVKGLQLWAVTLFEMRANLVVNLGFP